MDYSIGQVAKMNNMTISQLHYYDRQGLLPFINRTENGDRTFDEGSLKFLEMILCLKNTGMPIKKIKEFVQWTMDGEQTLPERMEMMLEQEQKVQQQIRDMQANLEKIQMKIKRYENEMN
ncbi:MerR family transcriptional regulator [Rossellomorea vietnamensis]|uniref:MerR family transcriptional regulator n=1 Tax=Rossellomorea vietnamensis TaxID=218284 RepID=A0A0P6W5X7_9BACI|nr:MerR family transcriptional regulator [Rossellomorea vietnamensis]KPL60323.1 MerR family transcriptional regulator [Rossellomorea vietnamensis]